MQNSGPTGSSTRRWSQGLVARAVAPNVATVRGGPGNDELIETGGADLADGGAGDDHLILDDPDGYRDAYVCGAGNDWLEVTLNGVPTEDAIANDCPPVGALSLDRRGRATLAGTASTASLSYRAHVPLALGRVSLIRATKTSRITVGTLPAHTIRGTGVLRFQLTARARRVLAHKASTNVLIVGAMRHAAAGEDQAPIGWTHSGSRILPRSLFRFSIVRR